MAAHPRVVAGSLLLTTALAIRIVASAEREPDLTRSIIVLTLAVVAFVVGLSSFVRMAAAVVAVGAILDASTWALAQRTSSRFEQESLERLNEGAAHLSRFVREVEKTLAVEAQEQKRSLTSASRPSRAALFEMLQRSERPAGTRRGSRLLDRSGNLVAWTGEHLPTPGSEHFEYDVTNVYIVHSVPLVIAGEPHTLQRFARVINDTAIGPMDLLENHSEWISGYKLHSGVLAGKPGSRRHVIARSGAEFLYADIEPRSKEAVLAKLRDRGMTASSTVVAIGILLVIFIAARERHRFSAGPELRTNAILFSSAAAILFAREVLLGVRVEDDRWSLFNFELFASRALGPFSRSPFDLLATSMALFALAFIFSRRVAIKSRALAIAEGAIIGTLVVLFTRFAANLVDNSRISPLPSHLIPRTPAQLLLLLSLLLMGGALVVLASRFRTTRHDMLLTVTMLAIVIPVALLTDSVAAERVQILTVAAIMLIPLVLSSILRHRFTRHAILGLVTAAIVYSPVSRFEQAKSDRFISETLAPLVGGESNQVRSMIDTTLREQFAKIELSTILPAAMSKTDLTDLAFALWAHSDISRWDVPVVLNIVDLDGANLSRFGVGLPQFDEADEPGDETLRVGRLVRELLHFDFPVEIKGIHAAGGRLHLVDPSDPGATAFTDIYRELFEHDREGADLKMASEPMVIDRRGVVQGTRRVRLARTPETYFAQLRAGEGMWEETTGADDDRHFIYRTENALYVFPAPLRTGGQELRLLGSVAIWALLLHLLVGYAALLPALIRTLTDWRAHMTFRVRTSLYLAGVVILPLLIFVIFVRAYLADRLESEYLARGQAALATAQQVIEDYLASAPSRSEPVLDDAILTWLARVIGHDLHLYRDDEVFASSRRDLFSAHVESPRLPGEVYRAIALGGGQLVRARHQSGEIRFVELYSPITLPREGTYTLALPFIVQGRQIEEQVNDLATTIYLLLVAVAVGALVVAHRAARGVTRPVQELVGGARAVAAGNFDPPLEAPSDPDLNLLVSTFRDMSRSLAQQQEDLRHERDRLQTLLENITAAVVVIDGSLRVVGSNRAARRLFTGSEEGTLQETFSSGQPKIDDFVNERHGGASATAEVEIEIEIEGNLRSYRLALIPLPDSDEEMVILEDVTEILRSNRLEAWSEMARQIAHEIKNPLTPIQLTAEHLRAVAHRGDGNLLETIDQSVENILRQVTTLKETSREFGDYASLRKPAREPIALGELLSEVSNTYATTAERGVHFQAEIEPDLPIFIGDRRLLRAAILNLVENALQATGGGGKVVLQGHRENDEVVVSVIDDGPGVEHELLPRIFDPYFSTKSSGTGLGLAIARKSIEEQGGSVSAENLEHGFRVAVRLPV